MERMHETTSLHDRINDPDNEHEVIDELEKIEQAVRNNVRLDSLYVTEGLELASVGGTASEYGRLPTHKPSRNVVDGLFGGEKRARVFALAKAPHPARLSDLSGA